MVAQAFSAGDSLTLKKSGSEDISSVGIGTIDGVVIRRASDANGEGIAAIRSQDEGATLQYRAPGSSSWGPAIPVPIDDLYLLEDGEDPDKWVRVEVYTAKLLTSTDTDVPDGTTSEGDPLAEDPEISTVPGVASVIATEYYTKVQIDAFFEGKSDADPAKQKVDWANITNTPPSLGHGTGTVTQHNDVSNAGSGVIISVNERGNIVTAVAHVTSDGSDHSYINQGVRDIDSPTFAGLTVGGTMTISSLSVGTISNGGSPIAFSDDINAPGQTITGGTLTDGTWATTAGVHTGIASLNSVLAAELSQLETIGTTTISAVQWAYLGAMGAQPLESESDPVFVSSAAYGIASGDITNWDTAYGWGDHGAAGYLTSVSGEDHSTLDKLLWSEAGHTVDTDFDLATHDLQNVVDIGAVGQADLLQLASGALTLNGTLDLNANNLTMGGGPLDMGGGYIYDSTGSNIIYADTSFLIYSDVNAGGVGIADFQVGNRGASQGIFTAQYRNAAAAGSPRAVFSFQPRNNADASVAEMVQWNMEKAAGTDSAKLEIKTLDAGSGTLQTRILIDAAQGDITLGYNQEFFLDDSAGFIMIGRGFTNPHGPLEVRKDQTAATKLIINNNGTVNASTSARLSFYDADTERSYLEHRRDGSGDMYMHSTGNIVISTSVGVDIVGGTLNLGGQDLGLGGGSIVDDTGLITLKDITTITRVSDVALNIYTDTGNDATLFLGETATVGAKWVYDGGTNLMELITLSPAALTALSVDRTTGITTFGAAVDLNTHNLTMGAGDIDMEGGNIDDVGSITMQEDGWIGIMGPAERIVFDGTAGEIRIVDANLDLDDNSIYNVGALEMHAAAIIYGESYLHFQTAAAQGIYFDFGGSCYFRDIDSASAVRLSIDSATGNVVMAGTLTVGTIANGGSDITISDAIHVEADSDSVSSFGRAKLGYDGSTADAMVLAHYDKMGTTNYALKQLASGAVSLNGNTGTDIEIRIGGVLAMYLQAGGINFNAGYSYNADHYDMVETSTPTPVGSHGKLYTKNDNKLYFQDGAGAEHEVTLK